MTNEREIKLFPHSKERINLLKMNAIIFNTLHRKVEKCIYTYMYLFLLAERRKETITRA